ncbi:response regulator transcription factor [Coralloluteibacterium stylophorae]
MSASVRLLLVDDHAMVRMGFRMLLEAAEEIVIVGEADSGEAGYRMQGELGADVVVMDIAMAGIGGIEALARMRARDPAVRVLVLSAHEDVVHPRRALRAGAAGYLCKRSAPEELLDAVRTVAAGGSYLEAATARRLALAEHGGAGTVEALSEREFAVFLKLAHGASVAAIAETLKLSPNTVGTHLYNIKQKLGASNQAELTLIALRNGLITL